MLSNWGSLLFDTSKDELIVGFDFGNGLWAFVSFVVVDDEMWL